MNSDSEVFLCFVRCARVSLLVTLCLVQMYEGFGIKHSPIQILFSQLLGGFLLFFFSSLTATQSVAYLFFAVCNAWVGRQLSGNNLVFHSFSTPLSSRVNSSLVQLLTAERMRRSFKSSSPLSVCITLDIPKRVQRGRTHSTRIPSKIPSKTRQPAYCR